MSRVWQLLSDWEAVTPQESATLRIYVYETEVTGELIAELLPLYKVEFDTLPNAAALILCITKKPTHYEFRKSSP